MSAYHFEAAIASIHAVSPDFERTDWKSIYHLYEALFAFNPSPVVALNKAIASSYAIGAEKALDELRRIRGLEKNHIYYASLGEVYLLLKKCPEARENFASAITFAPSNSEKQFLREKLAACDDLLSRSQ